MGNQLQRETLMDALERLQAQISALPLVINAQTTAELTQNAPGKWSKKEILGHLIDSALTNWRRFTEAQFMRPYCYQPYQQDQLVQVN